MDIYGVLSLLLLFGQQPIHVDGIFHPELSHGYCLVRATGAIYHEGVFYLLT